MTLEPTHTVSPIAQRRARFAERLVTSPLGSLLGMRLFYEGDSAVVDLPYNPRLDHSMGATHGGVIGILIDNAGWFTIAPHFDTWIVTVEYQVRLLAPVRQQHLRARGRLVHLGRRLSVAEMEVRTVPSPDAPFEAGRLVATGSGTFTVTNQPMRDPPEMPPGA